MKVLLVNPTRTGNDSYVSLPLHLVYIANSIKKAGHEVEIIDAHHLYHHQHNRNSTYTQPVIEDFIVKQISEMEFDILGIGGVVSSYDFTKRLVNNIKNIKPDIPIIIGGGMSMAVKELWLTKTNVDFLCESDGELVIKQFLKVYPDKEKLMKIPGLYVRHNGQFVSQKPYLPSNLDYIDYPDFDILDNLEDYKLILHDWINNVLPKEIQLSDKEFILPVVMTRGCVYDCTFCYHVNRLYRKHSKEYVIGLFKYLKEKYQVSHVLTWDDLIMADVNWLSDLCDELIKQNIGIKIFTGGGKPNLVTKELLDKMKQAGFVRISFGVESGSQKMLDVMNKQTTVEQNYDAIKNSIESRIFFHINLVIGMPGETKKTLSETSDFLISLAKKGVSSKHVSFAFATGYPGTKLWDYMIQHNIVTDTEKYLREQMGVGKYKYNLCGLSEYYLRYWMFITKKKMDIWCYISKR